MGELLEVLEHVGKEPNGWAVIVALVIYHQFAKAPMRARVRKLEVKLEAVARHLGVSIESGPHLVENPPNRAARRRQDRQTPPAA